LNGFNKKNKLGLKGLNPQVVGEWINKIIDKRQSTFATPLVKTSVVEKATVDEER